MTDYIDTYHEAIRRARLCTGVLIYRSDETGKQSWHVQDSTDDKEFWFDSFEDVCGAQGFARFVLGLKEDQIVVRMES